jgi:hypothetical protein
MESDEPATPEKGDQYERPDGSVEVVFAVVDGRVLTFREYPDVDAFTDGVAEAAYEGENRAVSELPGVEAFRDLDL